MEDGLPHSNHNKIIILIPSRLHSTRLPAKALLPINNLPLIMHVYKRAKLSKLANEVIVCCDDKKILREVKKHGGKAILTSKHHANGTERICEVIQKTPKAYSLVIDVQGDEPLISPEHIDEVIRYHLKNMDTDIILPNLKVKITNNSNIVKIVTNNKNDVIYISRANIPHAFKSSPKYLKKHLSIISFKPSALLKYGKSKVGQLEKIEDIELLRALEIGLKIKTINMTGDSFSIDVFEDYSRAKSQIKKDKYFKLYNNK